jgi:hypothetical protein
VSSFFYVELFSLCNMHMHMRCMRARRAAPPRAGRGVSRAAAPWTPRIEPGRGPRAGASGTQNAHTTIRLCVRLRPVPIRIPFSRRCSTPHPPAPHPPPHPPGGRGSSSHSSHRGERIRMSVKCYI